MVKHLLLLIVAAPLLAVGDVFDAVLWALPLGIRQRLAAGLMRSRWVRPTVRVITRPSVVWLANAVVLWFWHLPTAYGWALDHEVVHAAEHLSFLGVSVAFWWVLFRPAGARIGGGRGFCTCSRWDFREASWVRC